MYLGSVKFFKHLILAFLALIVIIPLVSVVVMAGRAAAMEKKINELNALFLSFEEFKNDGKDFSPADFYALMERLGVKKAEFLALLLEKDPNIPGAPDTYTNEQPANETSENVETTSSSGAVGRKITASRADPVFDAKSSPEYVNLYLDLYVERSGDKSESRYKDDRGYIYLTFDDGPSKHTPNILSYLGKHNVAATFFVVPDKNSSRFLNMILEKGHAIGVHSASHDYNKIYTSVETFLADFKKAYDLIYEQTGIKPEIFRFPGGSKNGYNHGVRQAIVEEMTRRGFIYFDWNVDSMDHADAGWTQMYNTVLKEVAANTAKGHGSIILMHDRPGGMNTVLVIEDIVVRLLKDPNGYKFGKLDRNVRPVQF